MAQARSYVRIFYRPLWALPVLALLLPLPADTGSVERGLVAPRVTREGAELTFSWLSLSKVPFDTEERGNDILLHFDEPVALEWDPALKTLCPDLREVSTRDAGRTVVLSLERPASGKRFLVYGRDGIDTSKNGLTLTWQRPDQTPKPIMGTALPLLPTVESPGKNKKSPQARKQQAPSRSAAHAQPDKTPVKQAARAAPVLAELPDGEQDSDVIFTMPAPRPRNAPGNAMAALSPSAGTAASQPAAAATNQPPAHEASAPAAQARPVKQPEAEAIQPEAPAAAQTHEPAAQQSEPAQTPRPAMIAADESGATGDISADETNAAAAYAALAPAAGHGEDSGHAEATAHAAAAPGGAPEQPAEQAAPAAEARVLQSVTLPLTETDSFATFMRNERLWIAASDSAHLTADMLQRANPNLPDRFESVPAEGGTVFTLKSPHGVAASVEKNEEGSKLVIEVSDQQTEGTRGGISPAPVTEDGKTSLTFATGKVESLITLRDPLTGESLRIVPQTTLGRGVKIPRSFVELKLPPTAQGIVIQPDSDDLKVAVAGDQVEVHAPAGLAVSPELLQKLEEAGKASYANTYLPYSAMRLEEGKSFYATQQKLIRKISAAPTPEEANKLRERLLGVYLSEGLFAEAYGMTGDILRVSYRYYVEHKIGAKRGAALFLMYRVSEAERAFSAPELKGSPETAMWLALCGDLLGKDNGTVNFSKLYEPIISTYPPVVIQKIAVIAADRSIARKEYDEAKAIFDLLRRDNIEEPVKKYVDYMRAKIYSETRNEDEAARIWEIQAEDVNDRLIRARAEFSLVNMLLRDEKLGVDEAQKRLEKIRIVWRGDGLELNLLTLLGSLYAEQREYAMALRAWRDIVLYYPSLPEAVTTAHKMEEMFVNLYNKGHGDDLPPLEALSLFYEFRDLVPTGGDGDLMIRNLSERLVRIDLLDRAARLLEHQIKNRLHGSERSRVGARLAEIYLMNRKPKEALDVLKTTGYGELAPGIQLTRIRLTAQALAQQGMLGKSIDVLSSDSSAEGSLLRLSMYWSNKDWTNVVTTAEEILGNRNDPSAALTLEESQVLLKLATAYVYERDSGQIQYLRDYFTPLLKDNPNRDSFLFITSESGAIDYENLNNLDKDINTVQGFISKKDEGPPETPAETPAAAAPAPAEAAPQAGG